MSRYPSYGPLDNPFADAGDSSFLRLNSRLRPDQLQPGEVVVSENGRMDINGSWQPRRPHTPLGEPLATDDETLTLPFFTYADTTASGSSRSGDTITLTFAAPHPFNDQTLAGISGVTGITPDPNGNRLITVVDNTTIEFDVAGATGTIGGTIVVGAPFIQDTIVNAVYGSCLYSDPKSNNDEYIIIATNSTAKAVKIATGVVSDIAYPAGVVISDSVDMIQAFDRVYIFRDGLTALEWDGDFTGTPAFTLVANGNYTQPIIFDSSNNATATNGVVTVTETAHGLSVGDTLVIVDGGSGSPPELTKGDRYIIATVPTADTFTFFAQVEDFGSKSIELSKPVSVGLGFTHMPAPPWAIYHQRRLWMPFNYVSSGSSGSPVITDREIRDELIASDIFDSTTYDQIRNQFRIASGGADFVVGLQPFAQDNLVVFMRNTIHIIGGVGADLANAQVQEITREVGCIARKSIVQVGNQILFLSDNGVYSVDFGDLYNLRGAALPLSEAIQPLIDRINPVTAANSVAIYHDNRYYLAVPLDDSTENNAVLVYNFLNKGWESVDTTSAPNWNIRNLIRASAGGFNRLFAINRLGGVHELEARVDDSDLIIDSIGGAATAFFIPSKLRTREYTLGTLERKKWNNYELVVQSTDTNASDLSITLLTDNPDSTTLIDTLSNRLGAVLPVGADVSFRGRTGNRRGYAASLELVPSAGRPIVRISKLTAQLTDRALSFKS